MTDNPAPSLALTFMQCRIDQITDELPHITAEDEWMAMIEEKELLIREMANRERR